MRVLYRTVFYNNFKFIYFLVFIVDNFLEFYFLGVKIIIVLRKISEGMHIKFTINCDFNL